MTYAFSQMFSIDRLQKMGEKFWVDENTAKVLGVILAEETYLWISLDLSAFAFFRQDFNS